MADKFNLKWNDFHSNVSNSFREFRNDKYLHDVTLVTDDNHYVAAHRLVLSASSEYFQSIFQNAGNSPNLKLLLCVQNVSKEDIENCLDYMYNGEVQIKQEGLDWFLNVAQRLQIKGLLNDHTDVKSENIHEEVPSHTIDSNYCETETTQHKTKPKMRKTVVALNQDTNIPDIKAQTDKFIEKLEDGNLKCSVCGKISADKANFNKIKNM